MDLIYVRSWRSDLLRVMVSVGMTRFGRVCDGKIVSQGSSESDLSPRDAMCSVRR